MEDFSGKMIERIKQALPKKEDLRPDFLRRAEVRKELEKRGFEDFDSLRVDDIGIGKMKKDSQKKWEFYGDFLEESMEGYIVVDCYLLDDQPMKLKWRAEVLCDREEKKRIKKLKEELGDNYHHEGDHVEISLEVYKDDLKDGFNTRDSQFPLFLQDREKKLGLKSNPHIKDDWKESSPMTYYFHSAKSKILRTIVDYVREHSLPEVVIQERFNPVKFGVNYDYSDKDKESSENELADSFVRGKIDGKFIYTLGGAEKFLELVGSEQYSLASEEHELIRGNIDAIADGNPQVVMDLGCGDGTKTRIILEKQISKGNASGYNPVDVSPRMIFEAAANVPEGTRVSGDIFDFTQPFGEKNPKDKKVLITLLGNTLGNGDAEYQNNLMRNIGASMKNADEFLVGVQLDYDFDKILAMYQDPKNLELARPMLEKLGIAKDDAEIFISGDRIKKEISLNIKMLCDKEIFIGKRLVKIAAGKIISLIVSHKYEVPEMEKLAGEASLEIKKKFLNQDESYALFLMEKKKSA